MGDIVWSDGWLLTLIYGRGPIDRQGIRDIGDFINHAGFADAEFTRRFTTAAAWRLHGNFDVRVHICREIAV